MQTFLTVILTLVLLQPEIRIGIKRTLFQAIRWFTVQRFSFKSMRLVRGAPSYESTLTKSVPK
jgi:hypothetical protein